MRALPRGRVHAKAVLTVLYSLVIFLSRPLVVADQQEGVGFHNRLFLVPVVCLSLTNITSNMNFGLF